MKALPRNVIIVLAIAEAVIIIALLQYFLRPKDQVTPELAESWLRAIVANDGQGAKTAADSMVRSGLEVIVQDRYKLLYERAGIKAELLEYPFNEADFLSWRQAWFCRQLAAELVATHGPADEIGALFAGVVQHLTPQTTPPETGEYLETTWKRGEATASQMCWLLAELAYQRGWEAVLINVNEGDDRKPVHMLCELRQMEKVYVADPWYHLLLPDYCLDDLVAQPAKVRELWPSYPQLAELLPQVAPPPPQEPPPAVPAVPVVPGVPVASPPKPTPQTIFSLPAMPQDCCNRNQQLARYLGELLGARCPRFGEDPFRRNSRYRALRLGTPHPAAVEIRLWRQPFALLVDTFAGKVSAP